MNKANLTWYEKKAAKFPATLFKYIPPSPSLHHDQTQGFLTQCMERAVC